MFIEKVITDIDCFALEQIYIVRDFLKADGNTGVRIIKHLKKLVS